MLCCKKEKFIKVHPIILVTPYNNPFILTFCRVPVYRSVFVRLANFSGKTSQTWECIIKLIMLKDSVDKFFGKKELLVRWIHFGGSWNMQSINIEFAFRISKWRNWNNFRGKGRSWIVEGPHNFPVCMQDDGVRLFAPRNFVQIWTLRNGLTSKLLLSK